ncbi:TetR/AcrR family transcriptional regulator [Streptococcus mutans]|jgi:Transcriptional regulator|nr:TetR/AcrR family transcriptional regulator [Streptococcus mutans]MCB4960310.1 TetR/AcrR family transcriptional regulator [Streptococcus mutans]
MRDVKAPEVRRQEIMEAALQIFMEKGYLETRTQDIIDKVKISRGLLYYHFKNKEDILYCLIEKYSQPVIQRLAKISQDKKLTAKDKLRTFFEATQIGSTDHTKENAGLQEIVDLEQNRYLMDRLAHEIIDLSSNYLAHILEQGNEEGLLALSHPQALARILMTAYTFIANELTTLKDKKKGEDYWFTFEHLLNCTLQVNLF